MQGQRTKSKSRLLHWQTETTRLQAEIARWKAKEAQWQTERGYSTLNCPPNCRLV